MANIVLLPLCLHVKPIALTLTTAFDEKNLLLRLREGDEAALTLLYKQYWQELFLSAYNVLHDRRACEDIVQDLFLQVWLRREVLDVQVSLKAYLTTAVRYQVFHSIKKTAKLQLLAKKLGGEKLAEACDLPLLQKDLHGNVNKAVAELPEKCRAIYRLSREQQLSHKEIAAHLNISIKTVENQLTIALKRLRHYLEEYSIISMLFFTFTFLL